MGAENEGENHYFIYTPLEEMYTRDTKPVKYYWLDRNVDAQYNREVLSSFREHAVVYPYRSYAILREVLSDPTLRDYAVRVIASSALEKEVYQ